MGYAIPNCSMEIALFLAQRGAVSGTVSSRTTFRAPNAALLPSHGKARTWQGAAHSRAAEEGEQKRESAAAAVGEGDAAEGGRGRREALLAETPRRRRHRSSAAEEPRCGDLRERAAGEEVKKPKSSTRKVKSTSNTGKSTTTEVESKKKKIPNRDPRFCAVPRCYCFGNAASPTIGGGDGELEEATNRPQNRPSSSSNRALPTNRGPPRQELRCRRSGWR